MIHPGQPFIFHDHLLKKTSLDVFKFNYLKIEVSTCVNRFWEEQSVGRPTRVVQPVQRTINNSVHKYTNVHEQSGCQSLPQSTRMGSNPLLMVDVKVYHMSVNKNGFTPFANGGCQSQQEWAQTLC